MNTLRQPRHASHSFPLSSFQTHSATPPHPIHPFTPNHHNHNHNQIRHATLIRRPHRPYTFTQLVTLSDGSTYTHRTTSPQPVYKSLKDTRNTPLWNPSSQKLMNMETDEAGQLRRFREKFGRGWDASAGSGEGQNGRRKEVEGGSGGAMEAQGGKGGALGREEVVEEEREEEEDNLLDLISGYGREAEEEGTAAGVREEKTRSGKGKGGEK